MEEGAKMSRGIDSQLLADRLSAEIRSQVCKNRMSIILNPSSFSLNVQKDSLHSELLRDLAKVAASPAVKEEDFHTTFLKALGRSE